MLSFRDSQWGFELDEEEDNAGMNKFVAHMMQFALARKRTLAEVLKECQTSFGKFVKEDDSGSDGDGDGDGGDGDGGSEEKEYEKWVDEEPVKKPKKTPADYIDPKQFNFPSIAKGPATQRLISDFAALKGTDTKTLAGFEARPHEGNLYCWRVQMYPPKDSVSGVKNLAVSSLQFLTPSSNCGKISSRSRTTMTPSISRCCSRASTPMTLPLSGFYILALRCVLDTSPLVAPFAWIS